MLLFFSLLVGSLMDGRRPAKEQMALRSKELTHSRVNDAQFDVQMLLLLFFLVNFSIIISTNTCWFLLIRNQSDNYSRSLKYQQSNWPGRQISGGRFSIQENVP